MNTQNTTSTDSLSASSIVQRAAAPTPSFWKKVQKIAFSVAAAAGIVVALPAAGIALPAVVLTVAKVIGVVAGSSIAQAQLTTDAAAPAAGNEASNDTTPAEQ